MNESGLYIFKIFGTIVKEGTISVPLDVCLEQDPLHVLIQMPLTGSFSAFELSDMGAYTPVKQGEKQHAVA